MRAISHYPKTVLTLLIVVGFLLRSLGLEAIPPALNSDELLKAFDGASVYRTGMDHHGASWPLFFKQSGEYSPPLYIYWAGFFAAPLGIHPYLVRLPSAVVGTLTILMVYLFVKEFSDKKTGLLTAALVTLSPWNIHYSRIGWEAILQAPLWLGGLYFLMRWVRNHRTVELCLSTLFFALVIYAYPAARLFVPLMMLIMVLVYGDDFWHDKKQTLVAFGVWLLVLLPYAISMIQHYEAMQARWRFLSVFNQNNGFLIFVQQYFQHLSPSFMFLFGNPNSYHMMCGGLAMTVLLPFFLVALVYMGKKRRRIHWVLFAWLLLFALPSSMTFDRYDIHSMPNPLRATCGLSLLEIISAIGFMALITSFSKTIYKRGLNIAMTAAILMNALYVGYDYIKQYPVYSASNWQYGLREAVEYVEAHKESYERVVVSHKVRLHPVALAVFVGHEPQPISGDDFPKYILPFFHYVPVYGDFGHQQYLQCEGQRLGSISRWYNLAKEKNLYLAEAGEITHAKPKKTILYPDGSKAYEIFSSEK